jgi:hypothetical protein
LHSTIQTAPATETGLALYLHIRAILHKVRPLTPVASRHCGWGTREYWARQSCANSCNVIFGRCPLISEPPRLW